MKKAIASAIVGGMLISTWAQAENGGRGGGDPTTNTADAIKMLITGYDLKKAMLNYLASLKIEQVSDAEVKSVFERVMANQALAKDIEASTYTLGDKCLDAYSNSVPASTVVGAEHAEVCFDSAKLEAELSNLSSEEMMIRLASLAFHEHIHHLRWFELVLT